MEVFTKISSIDFVDYKSKSYILIVKRKNDKDIISIFNKNYRKWKLKEKLRGFLK